MNGDSLGAQRLTATRALDQQKPDAAFAVVESLWFTRRRTQAPQANNLADIDRQLKDSESEVAKALAKNRD